MQEFEFQNNPFKTDKESAHSYISSYYEEKFLPYKNKEIVIAEVGVLHGESLCLWAEYFNHARIIGIDCNYPTLEKYKNYKNIEFYKTDAYDVDFVKKLPQLDIAIDDGPHKLHHQKKFIELYLPKIKEDGLLIIEDIQDIKNIFDLKVQADKTCNLIKKSIHKKHYDLRKNKNRYDDIIFEVIVKKSRKIFI